MPHSSGNRTSNGKRTDTAWAAYKLRWNRRALLLRSWRKRRQLTPVQDRTGAMRSGDIPCFATMRNEVRRLPDWLEHHRSLGVGHFLIVDNASDDGTTDYLATQPDVSLWTTPYSYKASRFGMDWLGYLQQRYARGWALTLDADELLIYPDWENRDLHDLTAWLDRQNRDVFGTMMLDLYPKGPLSTVAGDSPLDSLQWFDAHPYWAQKQPKLHNLWLQGGVRARAFFAADPDRAPTLNKTPLVRWRRGYTYVSSTHTMLPRKLNHIYDEGGQRHATGVLLHTKFWDGIIAKSAEEQERRQHFENSDLYQDYYNSLIGDPDLWTPASTRYTGWQQLVALGLMEPGDWA